MDLSVYITELLTEHGTINIPQIGVFRQVRMRGYYNADEGKLYPPYYQTEFEFKQVTDDSLLQFIIQKGKVSAASAKFFLDKYLQNILQQAEIGEVIIGRIGWLSKDEHNVLHFRPAPAVNAASAAFGFAPVSIHNTPEPEPRLTEDSSPANNQASTTPAEKAIEPAHPIIYSVEKELPTTPPPAEMQEQPAVKHEPVSPLLRQRSQPGKPPAEPAAAAFTAQAVQVPPSTTPPVTALPHDEDLDANARPFYLKLWFYALITGVVVVAAAIVFYPKMAQNGSTPSTSGPASAASPSMDSVIIKTPVVTDTAQTRQTEAADNQSLPASTEFAPEVETPLTAKAGHNIANTNNYKFVLIGGSYGTRQLAEEAAERYHAAGIDASAFENTGKTIKVALGFYKTYAEGQQAKKDLVKQQKVLSWKLYVETIRKK